MRLQIQAVVYLLLLATSGATPAEDAPKLKHAIPTDAVQFVTAFSPDSQAVTIIFSNLLIDTCNGPQSKTVRTAIKPIFGPH